MLRKKGLWIGLIALAVLGGGGAAAYKLWFAPRSDAHAPVSEPLPPARWHPMPGCAVE